MDGGTNKCMTKGKTICPPPLHGRVIKKVNNISNSKPGIVFLSG